MKWVFWSVSFGVLGQIFCNSSCLTLGCCIQIIAMQSAGSWQERAKKMREARAAAAGLHMEASAS